MTTTSAVSTSRTRWARSPRRVTRSNATSAVELLHAIEHLLRGRLEHLVDDTAVGEEHRAVGVAGGDGIVGDHHDGLVQVVDRSPHEVEDLRAGTRVQV